MTSMTGAGLVNEHARDASSCAATGQEAEINNFFQFGTSFDILNGSQFYPIQISPFDVTPFLQFPSTATSLEQSLALTRSVHKCRVNACKGYPHAFRELGTGNVRTGPCPSNHKLSVLLKSLST